MIGIFNTIQINGTELYRPTDFSPGREAVYAGEYTTCLGETIADLIGWRYSDMTLEWGSLPQYQLDVLLAMSGECTLVFTDADGVTHTESVIPTTKVFVATRHTGPDGHALWQDVSVGVRFLNVHH